MRNSMRNFLNHIKTMKNNEKLLNLIVELVEM